MHRRKARRSGQAPGVCVQFRALLGKRYAYLSNSKTLFIFGWLLPVLIALLPLIVGELQETEDVGPAVTRIPLGAAAFYGPGVRAFLHHVTGNSTNLSSNFEVLLENSNISIDKTKDLDKELLEVLKESYFEYGSKSAVVGVFNDTGIQVWHNPINLFGLPIVKNLVHTALLRTYSGNALSSITTDVALYPLPEEDRPQEKREDTPTDQERKQRLQELRELVLENWLYWGCIVTISFGLILSSFVVFPAAEAHNGARGLQLMTGVSGCVYLKADFFFDFLFYLIPMATIYGTFAILQQLSSLTTGALGVIVVSFAPLGILLPYFITDRIESDSSAHSVMMGVFAIGGPAAFILFMFIAFTTGSAGLRIPLLFFPPFLLAATTIRAINLEFEEEMCEILSHSSLDTQFCEKMSTFGSGIIQCCKALSEKTASTYSPGKKRLDVTTPYSPTWYGILPELVMMLALALPLYCCVLRTRRSAYGTGFKLRDLHTPHLDDDVDDEKELVNRLVRKKKFRRHAMLVRNLHKFFDDFYAVRGVYLALRPSECFGLVGVNGAGKTTTFQMLTALLEMTDGNAYMKSLILSEQPREWQSFIGYCPQRDALLSRLNAYETLRLFGRLRGVTGQELDQMAKRLIKVVDLEEHATKLCEHYSGGQKRKLCIAVALMGFPRVVFLDEPYAGVDVISRNNMREAITALKESTKTAIVLTSHNMAECEVSCDRFAIMVKGQMTCIGTMQQLKSKFGKGSSIQFVAPVASKINTKDLNQAVVTSFPGAEQNPEDVSAI
ncbi:ATP-binding cassette sub-family A member 17-like [Haemaphysalis longicornis]